MTTTSRRGGTVETVYAVLRERIIEGDYAPGLRLSQDALAAELEVSRTPLREAMHRLESEQLLIARANRGMTVAPTRFEQVEQCYAMRLLIEPPVLSAVLDDITADDLAAMDDALAAMESSRVRIRDFQREHLRFHEIALRHYPSDIREAVEALHLRIYRHQRIHFSRPHIPEDFTSVDRLLLESIRARDTTGTRHALEFHLLDAAVGMILEHSSDHPCASLKVAAKGLGIDLPLDDFLTWGPGGPCPIQWSQPTLLQPIETTNLRYIPPQDDTDAQTSPLGPNRGE